MGLAALIARRSLLQRPGRTIFSMLGIAVGIATVVGVFALDENTVAGLQRRYAPEWRPDLEVRPAAGLQDAGKRLGALDGVAEVAAFFQNQVTYAPVNQRAQAVRTSQATLLSADAQALREMGAYELAAGVELDPDSSQPEVLVGMAIAERLELEPGDTLTLQRPPHRVRRECVDGETRAVDPASSEEAPRIDFLVTGVLARKRLGRRSEAQILIVDYRFGEALFAGKPVDSRFWVRRNPAIDVERLEANLAQDFAYDIGKSVLVGQAADERAFRNGVRMAGLLALILGLYVIFHTLSMSIVERVREISTLQALGASRSQILRVFMGEAALLAGLGGVVGLVGGLALAQLLLKFGITTLGSGRFLPDFRIPWRTSLTLALTGVGVALLGAIFPLLRVGATNASAGLRGEAALARGGTTRTFHLFSALVLAALLPALYFVIVPVVGETNAALVRSVLLGVGLLALFVGLPLIVPDMLAFVCQLIAQPFARIWPFAGAMAARGMRDGRQRVSVCTAALALVVASFVGLKAMTRSLHAEVDQWAQAAVHDKLYVSGLKQGSLDFLQPALHSVPGVLGVEGDAARTFAPFLIMGQRIDELAAYGPIARDPELARALKTQHGLILSERVAKNLDYEIGDVVQLAKNAGKVQEFRVVAISDEYGFFPEPDERLYGVVSDHYMHNYFCLDTDTVARIGIRLDPGADPLSVERALRAAHPEAFRGARFRTGASIQESHRVDIDSDFRLFDIILGLTALLAGLGILNGQLLAAFERTKELGVLKALGVAPGQIAGMIWLESAVIGLLGGGLGAGLGLVLGPLIVETLEQLSGLELPQRGAGYWTPICIGGSVLIALLAGIYPVFRMNRTDAVRAVRTG